MDDFEGVEVADAGGDLVEGDFRLDGFDEVGVPVGFFGEEVVERGGTKFEGDVEEVVLFLLAVISNDVWMIV